MQNYWKPIKCARLHQKSSLFYFPSQTGGGGGEMGVNFPSQTGGGGGEMGVSFPSHTGGGGGEMGVSLPSRTGDEGGVAMGVMAKLAHGAARTATAMMDWNTDFIME